MLVSNLTQPGIYGVSVRVLGMGLGLGCSQVPCPTRERERGKVLGGPQGGFVVAEFGRGKGKSDTVCDFSRRFVLSHADNELMNPL